MKLKIYLIVLLVFQISCLVGQDNKEKVIRPILLDKSVLSGVGLKKIDFKEEPEKQFYQKNLYRGEDLSVYVVSLGTWTNQVDDFAFDEYIYLFHGASIVEPQLGVSQLFQTGDSFFAPKGFSGEWTIRAGKHLHYELSVISTRRADSTQTVEGLNHQLFDRSILSGTFIDLDEAGLYARTLVRGGELTVHLKAERPMEKRLSTPVKEQMIQLLSGQLRLSDSAGEEQVFYSGDFFVLPKGFTGKWVSEGHALVKYLAVEKTVWD